VIGTDFNVDGWSSYNADGVNFVRFFDSDSDTDSINSITNGKPGQILIIKFMSDVNILDNELGSLNSIDLDHSGGPSASFYQRDTLTLIFDGTSWSQIGTSFNNR
jgi:hypothetical protein